MAASLMGGETLLVVHPLQPVRHEVMAMVRPYGYRVLEATSALHAQAQLKRHSAVRLLFMELPGLEFGGLQAALWLAGLNPRLKVLLASAHIWNLYYQPGEFDQIAFCPTPFTASDLARLVRRTLD